MTKEWLVRRMIVVVALVAAVAGCGGSDDPLAPGTAPTVVEVVEDVDYYYACGNEVLELDDGRTFSPLVDQDAVDAEDYLGAATTVSLSGDLVLAAGQDLVLAVVAPGPGDDTGTLTIYDDGMAYWLSDSGIEAWLDAGVREYEWVC